MTDRAGRTDLHYAALDGDQARIEQLLREGFDPNAADTQGFTPLHFAVQSYEPEIVAMLIGGGADTEHPNRFGNTALCVAVLNSKGRGEVIEALLAAGADPDHVTNTGATPRTMAEQIANYDITQFFGDS